jgi:hypothetical protein
MGMRPSDDRLCDVLGCKNLGFSYECPGDRDHHRHGNIHILENTLAFVCAAHYIVADKWWNEGRLPENELKLKPR